MNRTRSIALLSLVAFLASLAMSVHASFDLHGGDAHAMTGAGAHGGQHGAVLDRDSGPGSDSTPPDGSHAVHCMASACSAATLPPDAAIDTTFRSHHLAAAAAPLLFVGMRHSPPLRPPR